MELGSGPGPEETDIHLEADISAAAIYLKGAGVNTEGRRSGTDRSLLRPVWMGVAIAILLGTANAYLLHTGIIEAESYFTELRIWLHRSGR